jgi:hypothetical protein
LVFDEVNSMYVPLEREGWYLCRWLDPAKKGDREFQGDQASAFRFLSRFSLAPSAMHMLRKEVERSFIQPLSDNEILNHISWELSRGRWKARQRPKLWEIGATGPSVAGANQTAAFPLSPRPAPQPVSSPRPDPPVFPDDIDAAAIASGLQAAAAMGAPFCEECEKAAAAAAGKN